MLGQVFNDRLFVQLDGYNRSGTPGGRIGQL